MPPVFGYWRMNKFLKLKLKWTLKEDTTFKNHNSRFSHFKPIYFKIFKLSKFDKTCVVMLTSNLEASCFLSTQINGD